jgi:hypothetical protein
VRRTPVVHASARATLELLGARAVPCMCTHTCSAHQSQNLQLGLVAREADCAVSLFWWLSSNQYLEIKPAPTALLLELASGPG